MKQQKCYENYPFWIVLFSNIVSIAIYAAGAIVLFQISWILMALYILYILLLEIMLLRKSCVNCYYYGKFCAFGQGKLCSLFFKKGDTNKFAHKIMTWKDIAPDFMVSLIPIVAGIILLIIDFNWLVLAMVLVVILLTFIGNGFVRGSLACKYCKQRKAGCPAERLFNQTKT
jgi:hypothetical protein